MCTRVLVTVNLNNLLSSERLLPVHDEFIWQELYFACLIYMDNFLFQIAVVVFPSPEELNVRSKKRAKEMGKEVPADAVNNMLGNGVPSPILLV